jgi:hypothetical protein
MRLLDYLTLRIIRPLLGVVGGLAPLRAIF